MESTSSNFNSLIDKIGEENLIKKLDLSLTEVLAAAREAECLDKIVKFIFINNDKLKLNKESLTRQEWREYMFNDRLEETFLSEKIYHEKVSFWYWLVGEKEQAMEYYYQLCNNETNFPDLKKKHPNVRYFSNHPAYQLEGNISKALRYTKINTPTSPFLTKKGYLILQKDSSKNAKLDNNLRQKLFDKLESEWFLREIYRTIEEA